MSPRFPELQQETALQRHGFKCEVWQEIDGTNRLVLYRKAGLPVIFGAYIDEGDSLLYIMDLPKKLTTEYRKIG